LTDRNTGPDDWVFLTEKGDNPRWANNAWDHIRPVLAKLGMAWVNYQVIRRNAVSLVKA
jgi:hypothetical protein